ncbi:MAG: fluoride exporter [Frankiaceae bacterium]|nr:fluoride exporter [Frankiaceae bacterium]
MTRIAKSSRIRARLRGLPIDPDIDAVEDRRHHDPSVSPFATAGRRRWPRIDWSVVAAVIVGGFFGGVTRYAVELAWPTPTGAFPWATFSVNTTGAFVLALTLVLVLEVLPPTRYVRAIVGTGFCGALTTFSSVVTSVDQLVAHGHADVAVGYVVASIAAGLAAASFGFALGRSVAAFGTTEEPA